MAIYHTNVRCEHAVHQQSKHNNCFAVAGSLTTQLLSTQRTQTSSTLQHETYLCFANSVEEHTHTHTHKKTHAQKPHAELDWANQTTLWTRCTTCCVGWLFCLDSWVFHVCVFVILYKLSKLQSSCWSTARTLEGDDGTMATLTPFPCYRASWPRLAQTPSLTTQPPAPPAPPAQTTQTTLATRSALVPRVSLIGQTGTNADADARMRDSSVRHMSETGGQQQRPNNQQQQQPVSPPKPVLLHQRAPAVTLRAPRADASPATSTSQVTRLVPESIGVFCLFVLLVVLLVLACTAQAKINRTCTAVDRLSFRIARIERLVSRLGSGSMR